MRKLNIAIIGLGNIGSYLFKYLNENKKFLTEKNNCKPIIKFVSAKNKNQKEEPASMLQGLGFGARACLLLALMVLLLIIERIFF